MHTCIHTYIHTYVHTYIHNNNTYIHTSYIHTCMHTYIHTYIQTVRQKEQTDTDDGQTVIETYRCIFRRTDGQTDTYHKHIYAFCLSLS